MFDRNSKQTLTQNKPKLKTKYNSIKTLKLKIIKLRLL
jgi:hypothetical protein